MNGFNSPYNRFGTITPRVYLIKQNNWPTPYSNIKKGDVDYFKTSYRSLLEWPLGMMRKFFQDVGNVYGRLAHKLIAHPPPNFNQFGF